MSEKQDLDFAVNTTKYHFGGGGSGGGLKVCVHCWQKRQVRHFGRSAPPLYLRYEEVCLTCRGQYVIDPGAKLAAIWRRKDVVRGLDEFLNAT